MPNQDNRFALLIDAENVSGKYIKRILDELSNEGVITYKRIYGDWTDNEKRSWKNVLLDWSVNPIQQYSYTTGKNATDSAMIIDAMDILYSGNCDGFVLVSSDSDFTRLATRLREAGKKVIGMGEKKTPNPFIVACDKFIYIEVIRAEAKAALATAEQEAAAQAAESAPVPAKTEPEPPKTEPSKGGKKGRKKTAEPAAAPAPEPEPEPQPAPAPAQKKVPKEVVHLIADAMDMIADEDGYAFMGELGNLLIRQQPDFDPRNYGFSKLTQLIKSIDRFEVDVRQTSNPHTKHIYLRDKKRK